MKRSNVIVCDICKQEIEERSETIRRFNCKYVNVKAEIRETNPLPPKMLNGKRIEEKGECELDICPYCINRIAYYSRKDRKREKIRGIWGMLKGTSGDL